jgi:hypothetical protein
MFVKLFYTYTKKKEEIVGYGMIVEHKTDYFTITSHRLKSL